MEPSSVKIDPADSGAMYQQFADIISPFLDNIRNIHLALSSKSLPEMAAMLNEADRSHKQLFALLKSTSAGAEVAGICLLNILGDRIGALRTLTDAMGTSTDQVANLDTCFLCRMSDDLLSPTKSKTPVVESA